MKKITIKELLEKIQLVALRFTFPLFFIIGTSFLLFLKINDEKAIIHENLWVFFGLSIPVSIAMSLLSEEFKKKFIGIGLQLLTILIVAIYAYTLPEKMIAYHFYQVFVIGIAFLLASFVVSFYKKNTDISFWEFSKTTILQLVITSIFAQVLMLGLSLAILSMQELFKLEIDEKIYGNIGVFCYGIFAPIFFLSNVPDKLEKHKLEFKFDKFLKLLGLYILLPILALYSIILYVYLIQIIGKWELPNGWVTWLVSVLALGGFLCMLIVYPLQLQKDKIATLFSRYFPILLFPLLLLMTVGIFRRFDDYGLTINRAYVFILNFWLIGVSFYLFLSKSKHLKWIIISFSIIAFLSAVGPWSVLNVTKQNMMNDIEELLSSNNYLKAGKVIDSTEIAKIKIDNKTEQLLASKIVYVDENFGIESLQPFFNIPIKNGNLVNKYLGIEINNDSNREDNYFNLQTKNENKVIETEGYSELLTIQKNDTSDLFFENEKYKVLYKTEQLFVSANKISKPIIINLKSHLNKIQNAKNQEFSLEERTIKAENYKLIIRSVSGEVKANNQIKLDQFEALLFLK